MTPYWTDPWLTVYAGDCRAVLAELEPESVHCVVTSPPYWGLRDYGVEGQIGLERTPEEYVSTLTGIFGEVRRVLRPEGTVWLNLGDCYATGAGSVGDRPGGGEQGDRFDQMMSERRYVRAARSRPIRFGWVIGPIAGSICRTNPAFALQADGWYRRDARRGLAGTGMTRKRSPKA